MSVSASSVPVYSTNNHYTAEVTNANIIVFREDGQEIWSSKTDRPIRSIAISPNGEYTAVGCDGGVIYFYQMDWSMTLLWTRTFGDTAITSISFQENGNFIEASNALNQAFLITRTGNRINGPITPAITPVPAATMLKSQISTAQNNLPSNNETSGFLGISFLWWGTLIFIIILVTLWATYSRPQKKRGPPITPPPMPPQNGMIYADSIPLGAAIYVDGIYAGVSPFTIYNVLPATHTIKATLNGYNSDTQRITLKAGQTVIYSPTLQRLPPPPSKSKPQPKPQPKLLFQDLITQLGAKTPKALEEAQKQLIIKVNTDGKPAIQQIIKELEKQPSGVKREIVNLLYYLSKESHEGQKVTEELILALTYSTPEVKWLIIQTLGRLKDKRALSALEAAVSDTDFLVKYWAIISLKSIQES